ncbi:MAG TPA: ComEC/Rec2 family competence protein [Anaerolineae bacterium]|nr:ComEC/Rec2 family competence protein [Anaerolineae bacterium]
MTRLVCLTLAWAAGILLAAQAISFSPVWFLLTIPVALVLHFGWRGAKWMPKANFALLGLLLGVARMTWAQPAITPDHVACYNDTGVVTLEGIIRREPDRRAALTNLYVDVEALALPTGETLAVRGVALLKAPPYTAARYGDRVQATGALQTPPEFEGFSYRDYLARRNVHSLLQHADVTVLASHQASRFWEALFGFKAHVHDVLLSLLPEPQASLLSGILLGIESGIPTDLNDAFAATGTSHIVAISGFNLSIIAAFFVGAARRLTHGRGVMPVAVGGVWLYTLFVGASPAVVRAAVMATVAITARHNIGVGRVHGPTSLATAAFVMLLVNPHNLWDVGFQLSVLATLGLILYTKPLEDAFERGLLHWLTPGQTQWLMSLLSEALIVTLAAQITTTGLIVGVFRRLSVVTLLTNLLILPVQSYVMFTGGAAVLVALIAPPLGRLLAWPAWGFLTWTIQCVTWTAAIPGASVELANVTLPLVWGYYGVLFTATWWFQQPAESRRGAWGWLKRRSKAQVLLPLVVLAGFFFYLYRLPDGRLHVHILDVGHGNAVFIETPGGKQLLIDGGPDAPRTLSALGRVMPFWDRSLDAVILTSPDNDRLNGLVPVLEHYAVDVVIQGTETGEGSVYARWQDLLGARPPETVGTLASGDAFTLDGVTLTALWPDVGTTGSLALRLTYGDTSVLLMGDATTRVEEMLVARYGRDLRSDALLVPRHGAQTGTTAPFLQAVQPSVVFISANRTGYPAPAVLARLRDVAVYRTDQHGTVELASDGAAVQVRTERKP